MNTKTACELALKLDGVTTKDHFGSDGFYVNGRIFATVWHDKGFVSLRLSPEEQRRFLLIDGEGFTEINNAWGRQGWTIAQMEFVEKKVFVEALQSAWKAAYEKGIRRSRSKK